MTKIIKILTTILIIYFISSFILILNLTNRPGFIPVMYFTIIVSLVVLLICSWKNKRSIIYFLFIFGIIIYNYIIILINQADSEVYNNFFLIFNDSAGKAYSNLIENKLLYVIIPYYLLVMVFISIIIDYIIVNLLINKIGKLFVLKIFNIIAAILLIYFTSCFMFLLWNAGYNSYEWYKFIPEMYLYYIVSILIYLIFRNKNILKLSIYYFILLIIIIGYNYTIILSCPEINPEPFFMRLYFNKFLIYDGFEAVRYSNFLEHLRFYIIISYILGIIGVIYFIIINIKIKLKQRNN